LVPINKSGVVITETRFSIGVILDGKNLMGSVGKFQCLLMVLFGASILVMISMSNGVVLAVLGNTSLGNSYESPTTETMLLE
jgi:hypothetical protein